MATTKANSKARGLDPQALKDFRHSVSVLRKKGIVSKRVRARTQEPTRYMRAKVRKFQDVLEGRAVAVKAKPSIRAKYIESEALEVRGSRIIVPKEYADQRVRISRGMVSVVRKLKNGQEEYVILPFKITDLPSLIKRMIEEQDSIDALKRPDEFFSFRIGENNAQVPFINAEEMAEYLLKYSSRLDHPIRGAKNTKQLLTFQRFKVKNGYFMRNPSESDKPKKPYPYSEKRRDEDAYNRSVRRLRDATKKKKQRKKETAEQRERRLNANRIRTAQWRQRQFEGS